MTKKRKHQAAAAIAGHSNEPPTPEKSPSKNPLFEQQTAFLNSLSDQERHDFLAPSFDPIRRGELWMQQADLGQDLVNAYSWATPDDRALRVLKHFAPMVEIGAGQGYWCQVMRDYGIDVVAYDADPSKGGKITKGSSAATTKNKSLVKTGGPKVLEQPDNRRRTLFLCYPDENASMSDNDNDKPPSQSMASACLKHYKGDYIIHVGELVLDATLSMDQAPWGRSSSPAFQEQLAAQFHCVLKIGLPSWLHVRDTLSVWKRSQVCSIVFEAEDGDDDEEGDEEYEYRYVFVTTCCRARIST